jgi:glycosyltransferase involved in cell wall biosynthesis
MTAGRRLSVCYAAPGQNLLPSAGPTRNVLSVAEALSQWADVTVAFRRILRPVDSDAYRVVSIEPDAAGGTVHRDDNATRGFHPLQHLRYCRRLWSFARKEAGSFDVVFEKGWRLSGLLSQAFCHNGVPGILVENDVRLWTEPLDGFRQIGKYILHQAADIVAESCSRRVSRIAAETDELKAMLVEERGVRPDRIQVIELGVDHSLFCPMDQASARSALGITPDALVMLYVGSIDEYHDLEALIDSLARVDGPSLELHVVGDGEFRARLERRAKQSAVACRFHDPVEHALVPRYIAAADLCVAPYRTTAFHGGLVPFSTLKIPEYMACGRPVVSVPSPAIRRLVADGVSGFLFPNDTSSWVPFLEALPSRERLREMGSVAAHAVESVAWNRTARTYLDICEQLVALDMRCRVSAVPIGRA